MSFFPSGFKGRDLESFFIMEECEANIFHFNGDSFGDAASCKQEEEHEEAFGLGALFSGEDKGFDF